MKRRSGKVWVTGIVVVLLLAGGIVAATLWLTPTGTLAERAAAKVYAGMSCNELKQVVPESWNLSMDIRSHSEFCCFSDGSTLWVRFDSANNVTSMLIPPSLNPMPPPVHPLTRLRRTLARVLPVLRE
jgi:hypothetical protein